MSDETIPIEGFSASLPDSQLGHESLQVPPIPPTLERIPLYSPLAIASYAFLANLPLGLFLLGLNLRARGRRMLGGLVILTAMAGALRLLATIDEDTSRGPRLILDLIIAWVLYQVEKRPYLDALAKGAVTARWWVPGVWLIVFVLAGLWYLGTR